MGKTGKVVGAVVMVLGMVGEGLGEEARAVAGRVMERVSGVYRTEVEALGRRVKEKGRERTEYAGEYIEGEGRSVQVRLTVQLPQMARLEGFRDREVVFDGVRGKNITRAADVGLIESLVLDTQEGMLAAMQGTASVRLLGRGFEVEKGRGKGDEAAGYDIFEVTMPDWLRGGGRWVTRLYYVDTETHLLRMTRYLDRSVEPAVEVETRFSMWGDMDGSAYPACIERYENGRRVFTFIATGIRWGAGEDESSYR